MPHLRTGFLQRIYSPNSICCLLEELFSVFRRLRWFGHVVRMDNDNWVKKCMTLKVNGRRYLGRPKKTWEQVNMSRKSHGKVVFNDNWLSDEIWVRKGNDSHKATNIVCNNTLIDISNGLSALVSYANGAKHKERVYNYSPMSILYFTKERQSNDDSPTCSSCGSSRRIDSCLLLLFHMQKSIGF